MTTERARLKKCLEVLDTLENNTHVLWAVDGVKVMSAPFGFEAACQTYDANPREPKGLQLDNGQQSAQGLASWSLAIQICEHLKLEYPGMMGRGFQTRACCAVVRQHIKAELDKLTA